MHCFYLDSLSFFNQGFRILKLETDLRFHTTEFYEHGST